MEEFPVEVDCSECRFTGEVIGWEDESNGTWGWVCPECHTEHSDDYIEDDVYYDNEDWMEL